MPDGTTLATAKISELPVATAANTTDKLEASQVDPSLGFVSRSITVAQVATVVAGGLPAPPTTLPPSGAAGGALTGTYPNPTLVGGPLSNYALTSSIPTTLPGPPTGTAGGGLSGSYPNPTIRPSTTNGDVLTTVAGVSAWAAPTGGGGGTATLATGAVGYGSGTNVLTGVLADFSWDATQKRLGVGTSTPGALAEFRSATAGTKALIVRGTTTSASQDYFDVVLTDPTGGGGSAMRVMGGATGINPLFQVDRAGDTQVSGWLRVLSTSGLVTNGADYFGAMLGNGAGGNLGTFAGLGAPTFSTFGSYGSIYLNGSSPGLPYYNNNGGTGWDRLVGESATQTLSNKTITGYATTASIPTTLPPNGAAGGDLSGTYPNPTVKSAAGAFAVTGALTGTTATFSGNANVGTLGASNTLSVRGTDGIGSLNVSSTSGTKFLTIKPESALNTAQMLYWNGAAAGTIEFFGNVNVTGTLTAPGAQIQMVSVETGAAASGTTLIPFDTTIPQQTEGDQYMTLAITPKSATSKLIIEVTWIGASTVGNNMGVALFQDAGANAIAAGHATVTIASAVVNISFRHIMTSGTISATTFKVRAGGSAAGTTQFNIGGTYGGVMASSIVIREVAP